MDDGSLPPGFVIDDQPPVPNAEVQPSGRLRITIGPKPLPLNGGAPGGATAGTAPPDQPDHPATLPDGFVLDAEPKKMGKGEALVAGLKQGLSANFSDELSGVNAAAGLPDAVSQTVGSAATLPVGLARLAYEHATGQPGEATKAYNDAVAQARQEQQQAQQQHPIMATLGNIGGALATSLLPIGAAGQGASLAARAGAGALAGAGYGAAYGAGEGEGLADRATRAGVGGVVGGITGGLAAPILAGALPAAKFISDKAGALLGHPIQAYRAAKDIDKTATERVANFLKYDAQNTPGGMGAADVAAANQTGQPIALMDMGNAATREGARAASNISPAAQATLGNKVDTRFEGQASRITDFLKNIVPTPADADRTQEAIEAAARVANKPAYAKAYAAGDRQIWTPELERLTAAPYVQRALSAAQTKWKNYAVHDGFGAMNPPFKVENGGIIRSGAGGMKVYPNIQMWDYAARNLQDMARAAPHGSEQGRLLNGLARQLKTELDTEVPEYGQARAGAAAFFGAENALEAGQKFLTSGSLTGARNAVNKMSSAERALFAEGFVSNLVSKVSKVTNNRDATITQIFNSNDGAARINIALGPKRAGELEAFLRREDMMDLARKAVNGNSSTIRQLMQSKLAMGASHGAVGAGIGAAADEIFNGELDWKKVLLGGVLGGTGVYTSAVNAKLAQSIAEKLVSDDPKVWRDVLRVAAANPKVATTIRNGEAFLQKLVGTTVGNHPPMLPAPTGAIPAAADQQQQ